MGGSLSRVQLAIAVLLAVVVSANLWGGDTSDEFSIPGTESQQAMDLLEERFPAQSGSSARVVFASPDGSEAEAEIVDGTLRVRVRCGDPLDEVVSDVTARVEAERPGL